MGGIAPHGQLIGTKVIKQGICVCPIFSQTYTYVTCRETGKIKCKMTYIPPDVAMSHLQQAENR